MDWIFDVRLTDGPLYWAALILGLGYFYSQRLKKDHALRKAIGAEAAEPVSEQK